MPRHRAYVPKGVIPAVLLPFTPDLAIDEAAFRGHLNDVTAASGVVFLVSTSWVASQKARLTAGYLTPDRPDGRATVCRACRTGRP